MRKISNKKYFMWTLPIVPVSMVTGIYLGTGGFIWGFSTAAVWALIVLLAHEYEII